VREARAAPEAEGAGPARQGDSLAQQAAGKEEALAFGEKMLALTREQASGFTHPHRFALPRPQLFSPTPPFSSHRLLRARAAP